MTDYEKMTEQALLEFLRNYGGVPKILSDSVLYSLEAGGKRVRPKLALQFARLCGTEERAALPFACAVEMIHTYSLIHDDLPCMDNDDMRRGKPSNHKVFGEDIALLAGDALLTLAFEIAASECAVASCGAEACVKGVNLLAKYAGAAGMVGGQVIDLINEGKNAPVEVLREMDHKKTACLIKAACELGCVAAGADGAHIAAASKYGECIGLAFQIKDDILDVTSSSEELGKPAGSDGENRKSTYVSLLGVAECEKLAAELTQNAVSALELFEGDVSELAEFAEYLANRKK